MSGDRDVLVASWITGGTTVIDFSDPAKPREIGYYVAEPENPERRSSTFASYWYDGHIYVNNALNSRGFDVLSMQPALPGLVGQDRMNPQTQEPPDRACARSVRDTASCGPVIRDNAMRCQASVRSAPSRTHIQRGARLLRPQTGATARD